MKSFGQFLHLESTFEEKDYVCERMVEFLMGAAKREASDTLSFQLLEALCLEFSCTYLLEDAKVHLQFYR